MSKASMLTQTYFPKSNSGLRLNKFEDDPRHNITDEETKIIDDNSIVKYGLSDACKKNQKYKQLMIEIGLDSLSENEIYFGCENHIYGSKINYRKSLIRNFKYEHCVKDVDYAVKDQIIQHWKNGYKIKRVASIFGVDETLWRLVINQYKFWDKLKEKESIRSKLWYKVTIQHINKTKEFLMNNYLNKITLESLRSHLNDWDNLAKLSKSGVYYLLTWVLKYSYIRAHLLPK